MMDRVRHPGLCIAAAVLVLLFVSGYALDRAFPLPPPGRDAPFALLVAARDGTPLRAFPDKHYVWRHPITLAEVSPLYTEALIGYEDRAFWWHPGVNPFALVRAASSIRRRVRCSANCIRSCAPFNWSCTTPSAKS